MKAVEIFLWNNLKVEREKYQIKAFLPYRYTDTNFLVFEIPVWNKTFVVFELAANIRDTVAFFICSIV